MRPFSLPKARCSSHGLIGALALIAVAGVAGQPASAARATVDLTAFSLEELMQMEVYSASKFGQKASEAPSAVTVITADDIKTRGYRTLADVLRGLPGVYVNYDRNYSYVGVRGFGRSGDYNDRLLFLVDGYRINENVFDQALVGTDFVLDVDLIDRVEFLPAGPATALYGNNAFFGVISIATKPGKKWQGPELSGAAASAKTGQARATYGRQLNNGMDVLVSASGYDSQGADLYFAEFDQPPLRDGRAVGLDHDSFRQVFGKLSFEGWRIEAAHADRVKGTPTASFNQDFNDPRSEFRDRQTFVDLSYRKAWTPHLNAQGRLFHGAYDFLGRFISGGGEFPLEATGQWWGGEFQLVDTAFDRHKLAFGGEYQRDLRRDQVMYDPTGAAFFSSRARGDRWGFYALDEVALTDRTAFGFGIRYDRATNGEGNLNPRLSLVHQWDARTTFKLLYSTAFRAPNAFELHSYLADPNADLKSETIRTYEFIFEKNLDSKTRFDASLYHYVITDLIDQSINPDTGFPTFGNLSRVRADGFNLNISRRWSDGRRLQASYSGQLAEDDAGRWLDNSPRHLAKLNWTQPLWGESWRANVEVHYIGQRRSTQGNTVDGVLLTHLNLLGQPLGKNLDVALGVYNLFDQEYADPAGDEHLQAQIPQDGRTWRLKLDYRF
ncbi:MAG TPA: TonB-dependent receptor [Candidatus Competibacter sp.]|nr:TonB-dependent receptor [Candidatus Competibacter sp.]